MPFQLGSGMFTTATVNNIGPNTSSTSSQDSFHSTAISLVQHPKPGTERCTDVFNPVRSLVSRKTAAHPSYYTDVPPLTLPSTKLILWFPTLVLSWYLLPVSKLSGALWRWGQEKEGELATTSLEFEYLH